AGVPRTGDVILALVCRELQGGWGIRTVLEKYTADFGVVTEPTWFSVGYNPSPGIARIQVDVRGRTAHTSQKGLAVNATTKLADVIKGLEAIDWGELATQGAGMPADAFGRPPTDGGPEEPGRSP